MNIMRMQNATQPYAWGSKTFIHQLLDDNSSEPIAELWMGAHPLLPSLIQNGDKFIALNQMLASDPKLFLGEYSEQSFGSELPFLLKVLAADSPLSIQVHPDAEQAKAGFERENRAGIDLKSSIRNYKDDHHKPELIVALTGFTAMCGFRPSTELCSLLQHYLPHCSLPEMRTYLAESNAINLKALYAALMQTSEKDEILSGYLSIVKQNSATNEKTRLIELWSEKLSFLYPGDIGILSPLLLNIITLKPLQGLYLQAGILHAYLQGAGIEIMASSDNVLRGGLTPKHVDVPELLQILDFASFDPFILSGVRVSSTESAYPTSATEFALSVIKHEADLQTGIEPAGSAEILFCAEGSFEIDNCSQILTIKKGQSLFVPYETEGYCIRGLGMLFRARCNL